jgi:hypothetical protein
MTARLAAAFVLGTLAGATAHKRYVGPAFALAAIRQVLTARTEARATLPTQPHITSRET